MLSMRIDPPTYDNTKGLVSMSGMISEGLITSSGLITTLSFKPLTLLVMQQKALLLCIRARKIGILPYCLHCSVSSLCYTIFWSPYRS